MCMKKLLTYLFIVFVILLVWLSARHKHIHNLLNMHTVHDPKSGPIDTQLMQDLFFLFIYMFYLFIFFKDILHSTANCHKKTDFSRHSVNTVHMYIPRGHLRACILAGIKLLHVCVWLVRWRTHTFHTYLAIKWQRESVCI